VFAFPGINVMQTGIANLDLASLQSVDGPIVAGGNPALRALRLPALSTATQISGFLDIRFNTGLTSLAGLDALTSVGGDLEFQGNDTLPSDVIAAFRRRLGH
jgi:hypothetical protein